MKKITLKVNDKKIEAEAGQSLLKACKEAGENIPVMCDFEGLSTVGACRLCLVELEGSKKLLPACATTVSEGQVIQTNTDKLKKYRRITTELFFSERNHICSVCVANNNCELQDMGYEVGMTSVRFPYLRQNLQLDGSHPKYIMDHNRCIMCTRCVRTCDEVEGAHNLDVMNRGYQTRIISDFNQPWGESTTCTWCNKCLQVCPTGALWPKDQSIGRTEKFPEMVTELVKKRKAPK